MAMRRRSSIMYLGHQGSEQNSNENSKKTSLTEAKPLPRPVHLSRISDAGSHVFQEEVIAKINSSAATSPSNATDDDRNERAEQNLQELNFYYGIVKRNLMRYQSATTGLYPANSSEKKVGSIRDTLYCSYATWSLHQAYKKIDNDQGKCYELGQSTVLALQGILSCWMRQSESLELFKSQQSPDNALHSKFDLFTGFEVESTSEYGHLQLDIVSLYLLFLVQSIASGLQVIGTAHEVAFVQNLVFYVERAYRTPDFGMWERGTIYNDGTPEVHASSIGMAKAALESINGFNLFGEYGASWSVVYVDIDAHNRNRSIFEILLPRESASKECDAALLSVISFPAFATHDENWYSTTKSNIIKSLEGPWGFRRFSRDGLGCVLEPENEQTYQEGMINQFTGIESEWPLFHAFMIIDGVFKNLDSQVEKHQRALKQLLKYTERGDPIMPKFYYVPSDCVADEKANPGSQFRFASDEGSSGSNIFLWGQSMLIISDLLASQLLKVHELDPIRRYLPSATRPKAAGRYSTFELTHHQDSMVQIVLISESRRLQASLSTYGIVTQTPDEIEPVQIWSQWDMVKVFEKLGQDKKLGLSGRPARPIGALGSSKIYRVSGLTVLGYPLIFSATEFYISHDLALLTDHIRTDISFIARRWRLRGRPTYCVVIREENMKDPQFPELLNLLLEIRSLKVDNVKICLGRLQNLMNSACIEHLDFSNSFNVNELDIEPFVQIQHNLYDGNFIEMIRPQKLKREDVNDVNDFHEKFVNKPDDEIIKEILGSEHVYQRIRLLGLLMQRHGENFNVTSESTVKSHLEELNKKAGALRYWSAVRYSSSLLRQMIDSISPYVTQILVSGKHVTVGTIGESFTLFDKPMTPTEIQHAIYTKVQPFNIISAVLQQELIVYCGKLIAANPELFAGILVVRMGWLLRALELYRTMTMEHPAPIDCCSPHTLRKLVHTVLLESRLIDLNYQCKKEGSPYKVDALTEELEEFRIGSSKTTLSVHQVRQLSGCLIRVPDNFYVDIYLILTKTQGGIFIQNQHLPQEPTISKMTSTELTFAHQFENMLNAYKQPVQKQMAVEFFSVLSKIIKRHPEITFIESLHVDEMIESAIKLYAEDHKISPEESQEKFHCDTVAQTSTYMGKAIILSLLQGKKSLSQFAFNAAASEFHCHVQ